jgi:23S rRNA pseudouridine2605 synthase
VASRRRAEDLIRAGRVAVNGAPAGLGDAADPRRDVVTLDGRRLRAEPLEYWLVHKPRGVLTTARDPQGRATVLDLVRGSRVRLFPVGRLDRDTEGLLLLTNDGPLAHALLHPSHEVEREYDVRVRGQVRDATFRQLERGVELDDGRTAPAAVARVRREARSDTTRFHLVLGEGRKRQIRRSLAALGHPVLALRRVRMGPLRLGRLAPGDARRLEPRELRALERVAARSPGRGDRQ